MSSNKHEVDPTPNVSQYDVQVSVGCINRISYFRVSTHRIIESFGVGDDVLARNQQA